jgi:hypothetical protein
MVLNPAGIIPESNPSAGSRHLNEMLKRVQHDGKKCVIPNLFRNLEFGNNNKSIAFVLVGERDRWLIGYCGFLIGNVNSQYISVG